VLSGLFYLCWIPVPLLFAVFLFYRDRAQFLYFSCTFFLVNILGFIIYYAYPAAPPWYVQQHGFEFYPHTPGSTAGLGRFDVFFNINLFKSLYAKSSNVFAAMPSLHSSLPAGCFVLWAKEPAGPGECTFLPLSWLVIWFSAIIPAITIYWTCWPALHAALWEYFCLNFTIRQQFLFPVCK